MATSTAQVFECAPSATEEMASSSRLKSKGVIATDGEVQAGDWNEVVRNYTNGREILLRFGMVSKGIERASKLRARLLTS